MCAGAKLSDGVVIPDVVVYRPDHPPIRDIYVVPADVVLAVEIVSRSTRRMDRLVKPAVLAADGVPLPSPLSSPRPLRRHPGHHPPHLTAPTCRTDRPHLAIAARCGPSGPSNQ